MIELHPDPSKARERLRQLFEAFFTALIVFFDTPRWRRARHEVCNGDELDDLEDLSKEYILQVNTI